MTTPAGAVGDDLTRTLLALIRVEQAGEWPTLDLVAAEAGVSRTSTYLRLQRLRARELIGWEPGTAGTLRSLVHPVAVF